MKKAWAVLALVTACVVFVAADNGSQTRSAAGVYDANGKFIGTLVDHGSPVHGFGELIVYVPSRQQLVPFDLRGNVGSMALYFTTSDCSGTAYYIHDLFGSSTVAEFRSHLYTTRPAGNPVTPGTIQRSAYSYHQCTATLPTDMGSGMVEPVELMPVTEPLPFTVPLAQPLALR